MELADIQLGCQVGWSITDCISCSCDLGGMDTGGRIGLHMLYPQYAFGGKRRYPASSAGSGEKKLNFTYHSTLKIPALEVAGRHQLLNAFQSEGSK